jgi:hypothetical protein
MTVLRGIALGFGLLAICVDAAWLVSNYRANPLRLTVREYYDCWLSQGEVYITNFPEHRARVSLALKGISAGGTARPASLPAPWVQRFKLGRIAGILIGLVMLACLGSAFLDRIRNSHSEKCAICGYDLRASGETCPECGAPTAAKRPLRRSPAIILIGLSIVLYVLALSIDLSSRQGRLRQAQMSGSVEATTTPEDGKERGPTTSPIPFPARAFQADPGRLPGYRDRR